MTFKDELEAQRIKDKQEAAGKSTNTPWDVSNFKPGGTAGVLVTSPNMGREMYASETKDLPASSLMKLGFAGPTDYLRKPSDVPNYYALNFNERDLFNAAAKSIHPLKTGEAFYNELIQASYDLSISGIYMSPQDLAYEAYEKSSKEGSGKRGRYTGPVATTTLANERDLRSTADAVASTVIGRGITDEEFQKVLKQVRVAERAEPTVTTPGVGSSVTQSGLSAQGRQDIIRDALMKGPEAKDYSKATKMMDVFYKALESRPEGA